MQFVLIAILLGIAIIGGGTLNSAPYSPAEKRDPIQFYESKLKLYKRAYPVYAQLAEAYFMKGKYTHDPSYLSRSREAALRSIRIAPNFRAYKVLSALSSFSHRFEDAIMWARKGMKTESGDSILNAIEIEALIALERFDLAERRLADMDSEGFYGLVSAGQVLRAKGETEKSAEMFVKASDLALSKNSEELAIWAKVMAAGVYLDSGFYQKAKPYLDEIAPLASKNREFLIHQAEYLQSLGKKEDALKIYEKLLVSVEDPFINDKAFRLAEELGRTEEAEIYFKNAELGYQLAIDAGEIYTYGPLSELYFERQDKLQRAHELAVLNLKHLPNKKAKSTLSKIETELRKIKNLTN